MENLNDDVLMEIFSYCGKCDELSLTCKRFYNLVCNLKRNKYRVRINPKMLKNKIFYESLINPRKVFDELEISFPSYIQSEKRNSRYIYEKIKMISSLNGANIKKLILFYGKIDPEYFFDFLNLFPNLEVLCLNEIHVYHYNKSIGTLNLISLKDLTIIRCNEDTTTFFGHHLPQNILTSLNVNHHIPDLLFNQQQSLRKLNLCGKMSSEWLPIPNLTTLELNLCEEQNLCSILKQQPDIEELDIKNFVKAINGNKETLRTLCNLKKLKILAMDVNDLLYVEVCINFSKLKILEELQLLDSTDNGRVSEILEIIMEISFIKLENLQKLTIDIKRIEITEDQIRRMGKNYPRLNYLKLTSKLPLPLVIFLDSFKCLNSLKVYYKPNRELSTICSTLDDKIFPNLQSLNIGGFLFDDLHMLYVKKLQKWFPNWK